MSLGSEEIMWLPQGTEQEFTSASRVSTEGVLYASAPVTGGTELVPHTKQCE